MKESKRTLLTTADGSATIAIPELQVTYHSRRGAVRESVHVFIQAGLHYGLRQPFQKPIYLFEMGFGTGLNALLTLLEAEKLQIPIHYTAVELYPLAAEETTALNYPDVLGIDPALFQQLHTSRWQRDVALTHFFTLHKVATSLHEFTPAQLFHLVYYDAFAPAAQPELWTVEVFKKLYELLQPGGILVTYCAKGDVRRALAAAGFGVKKLPGPPGKREMLRAERSL